MHNVLLLQALPLEYYPPVTNLIRHLAGTGDCQLTVVAAPTPTGLSPFAHEGVHIVRTLRVPRISGAALLTQLSFVLATAWIRLGFRPDVVISFEPHSALPAILLRRWPGHPPAFFVHHHEYYAPGDLGGKGGRLPALLGRLEKRHLLPGAVWISQTNAERLRRFQRDHGLSDSNRLRVLPNYPPRKWNAISNRAWLNPAPPWKLVYVGSLSLGDTYLAEVLRWVASRREDVTLDLYAHHSPAEVRAFLDALDAPNIRFFPQGVAYDELPETLVDYHLGLVLYRGKTLNFVYNQPNKLFEYLACGLDVWYPPVMEGIAPLRREHVFPKVIAVDFEDLEKIDLARLLDRDGLDRADETPCAEVALAPLVEKLKESPTL